MANVTIRIPNRTLRPVLQTNCKLWLIWDVESSATQLAYLGGVLRIMSISLKVRWKRRACTLCVFRIGRL
jgi:hypothetical protein